MENEIKNLMENNRNQLEEITEMKNTIELLKVKLKSHEDIIINLETKLENIQKSENKSIEFFKSIRRDMIFSAPHHEFGSCEVDYEL